MDEDNVLLLQMQKHFLHFRHIQVKVMRLHEQQEQVKRKEKRTSWISLRIEARSRLGQHDQLIKILKKHDLQKLADYNRLPIHIFEEVLGRVAPRITRQNTWFHEAMSPEKTDNQFVIAGHMALLQVS